MVASAWVFDDSGTAWKADDPRLAANLNTRLPPDSLMRFASKNLGFVIVQKKGQLAEISFHNSVVSHLALLGSVFWLFDHQVTRTRLVLRDQANVVPLAPTRGAAVHYLTTLAEQRAARCKITYEEQPVDASPFADKWKLASKMFELPMNDSHRIQLLDELFGGFFAMTVLDPDCGDYRITALGSATRAADDVFARRCIGRTFREASDAEYGNAVADQLRGVPIRPVPHVLRLVAKVNWAPRRTTLHRYSRLALPIPAADGRHRMLTATVEY